MPDSLNIPAPQAPTAGWYADPEGRTRWWNGSDWADIYQPTDAAYAPYAPRRVNHILHAILTILTGVWGFVWLALVLRNRGV